MRLRVGNPYREAHGRPLRVVEWITPSWGIKPSDYTEAAGSLTAAMSGALGGLKLAATKERREVEGYVNTSLLPTGGLFVAVMLYEDDCGAECSHHAGVRFVRAPQMGGGDLRKMVDSFGESDEYRLGRGHDREVLRVLGFQTTDEKHALGLVTIPEAALPGCVARGCFTDGPLRQETP